MKLKRLAFTGIIFVCFMSVNNLCGQSLMQKAQEAEKRAQVLKLEEGDRYTKVLDSRNLEAYEQYIQDYPRSKNTIEIKKRAAEMELWQSALTSNTISSYQNYLDETTYHWFDNEATEAINRIQKAIEKEDWEQICEIGTITAFQNYLQEKPFTAYKIEAENAINKLEGAEVWKIIKSSSDQIEIQNFINQYPHAVEVVNAQLKLHELKGMEYYERQDFNLAYTEFSYIDKDSIANENRSAFDTVMEWYDYTQLNSDSSEWALITFFEKYPNTQYKTQVNNLLAIVKAKTLSDNATESDYNQIRSYVTNDSTHKIVESYIVSNKAKQKKIQKSLKVKERDQNGGLFNLGVEFLDIGWNGVYKNDGLQIYYYDIGAMIRIGNYSSRVQFACGFKLGAIWYNYNIEQDQYLSASRIENKSFHMPIYTQLKFNLFKLNLSRFFISGQYQYNAVREDAIENTMSWGTGCGLAWKHIDWLLYYRQDIGNNYKINQNQHFFGISVIYFFKL